MLKRIAVAIHALTNDIMYDMKYDSSIVLYFPLLISELPPKKALVSGGLSPNLRNTSTIAIAALTVILPNAKTNRNVKMVFLLNVSIRLINTDKIHMLNV